MVDTPDIFVDQSSDGFRKSLAQAGYIDNGKKLRGKCAWNTDGVSHEAVVDVFLEDFPFSPPQVYLVSVDNKVVPTFHIEHEGNLCLWDPSLQFKTHPWLNVNEFLQKVEGWFQKTAKGWPEGSDGDLERYFELDSGEVILYDDNVIKDGFFRTSYPKNKVIHVIEKLSWKPNESRMRSKGVRRREKGLAWIKHIEELRRPIKIWADLEPIIGSQISMLLKLVDLESISYILFRYTHNDKPLLLAIKVVRRIGMDPQLLSVESADKSMSTRILRSSDPLSDLVNKKVLVVGCGAIGSHMTDLLFRCGLRHLTLIDPEKLRPGNLVRHLANNAEVGINKALAVKACLLSRGFSVEGIDVLSTRLIKTSEAITYTEKHDLVVDATANSKVTTLLAWASLKLKKPMMSICLQRNGEIIRIDRFPVKSAKEHLPITEVGESESAMYEVGCGNPVSKTSPQSVVKAATLGCDFALDILSEIENLPYTQIEVIKSQADKPYDKKGIIEK